MLTINDRIQSNHYCRQIINSFKKLLKQKNVKNILKIVIWILLIIGMHIKVIRFLKIGLFNAKYDLKKDFVKNIVMIVKLKKL